MSNAFHFFVILVIRLFVIFWGRFATQLALNFCHINPDAVGFAVAFLGNSAVLQPLLSGKIDGLGAVVTDVVPRMITIGIREDKFAFIVDEFVDFDTEFAL